MGFEEKTHVCLKGAWGSLLTLFRKLMVFIQLPNHSGCPGPWEVPSATSW